MARGRRPQVQVTVPGVDVPHNPRPVGPLLGDTPYGYDPMKGSDVHCSGVMASRSHEHDEDRRYGVDTVSARQLKYFNPLRERREREDEE